MNDEHHRFLLLLRQPPARLRVEEVAWFLNCHPNDVPILVSARLLKPLGNPPANGVKFFSTAEVLELAKDRAWLARMSNAIVQHWQRRNDGAKRRALGGGPDRGDEGAARAAA